MTLNNHVGASLHNAQHPALDPSATQQKQPTATSLKREGARRSSVLPARFAAKITLEPNTGCWLWLGYIDKVTGYGQAKHEGRTTSAHLAVYRELRGEHSTEDLDHRCRVRSCVNPDHLEPVTDKVNVGRSPIAPTAVNARKVECVNGHPFTPDNTRYDRGKRYCLECKRRRTRVSARRRRARGRGDVA